MLIEMATELSHGLVRQIVDLEACLEAKRTESHHRHR